jgi:hypothetical protein
VARELTLPKAKRSMHDRAGVLDLFRDELHCFEVTAIADSVNDAMAEQDTWPDVESMVPGLFLPSPVTWLERYTTNRDGQPTRVGYVIFKEGDWFVLKCAVKDNVGLYAVSACRFRARGTLEAGDSRIEVDVIDDPEDNETVDDFYKRNPLVDAMLKRAEEPNIPNEERLRLLGLIKKERDRLERVVEDIAISYQASAFKLENIEAVKHGVATTVMLLNLINTPGLVGLRQHEPHRGLAKDLARAGVGSYPLRSWSEVVVKAHSEFAGPGEREAGVTFRKCLHFVRSHRRRYRDGHVTIIPAHWRGDPALGIKRTRYRVEP